MVINVCRESGRGRRRVHDVHRGMYLLFYTQCGNRVRGVRLKLPTSSCHIYVEIIVGFDDLSVFCDGRVYENSLCQESE